MGRECKNLGEIRGNVEVSAEVVGEVVVNV